MNRRARFIAVQAVLTAVLMGVIVVTLINPNGDNALFAVEVPAPVAPGPPGGEPADEGSQGGRDGASGHGQGGPAGGGSGEGVFAPPPAGVAGTGDAGEAAPVTPPAEPTDEGPAGEQYGDTLARLSDAVD